MCNLDQLTADSGQQKAMCRDSAAMLDKFCLELIGSNVQFGNLHPICMFGSSQYKCLCTSCYPSQRQIVLRMYPELQALRFVSAFVLNPQQYYLLKEGNSACTWRAIQHCQRSMIHLALVQKIPQEFAKDTLPGRLANQLLSWSGANSRV